MPTSPSDFLMFFTPHICFTLILHNSFLSTTLSFKLVLCKEEKCQFSNSSVMCFSVITIPRNVECKVILHENYFILAEVL